MPLPVLHEPRLRPARRLLPPVIEHAGAQVVEPDRAFPAQEVRGIEAQLLRPVLKRNAQRKLGRGVEHIVHEVPHSCLRVLEPVPQHDADDVLALAQIGGDVISVVVGDVVRVGDIGGQEAFRDFPAVHEQVVEAQAAEDNLPLRLCPGQREALPEERGRHMLQVGGMLSALADELS